MENPIYYLQLTLRWTKAKRNIITATYNNGLRSIEREFAIGDVIPTVINIDEEE